MSQRVEQQNNITYRQKKQLEKDIVTLSSNEHTEILNIIRNSNQKYSENNAGVYINLKFIDNQTIKSIIEFVDFCKKNKKKESEENDAKSNKANKKTNKNKTGIGKNYTLSKEDITSQLKRLKEQKQENFSFQNFLDKLSVTNIKTFKKNEKIVYPQLKQTKKKFDPLGDRILKKCKDTYKNTDFSDTYSDDNSIENQDNLTKNLDKIINNSLLNKEAFNDMDEDEEDEDMYTYADDDDDEEYDETDSVSISNNNIKNITKLKYDDEEESMDDDDE